MPMANNTAAAINRYVAALFAANARVDNLYYNLKHKGYNNLADAIHEPVAHQMGAIADRVTDMMDENGARPIRLGIPDYVGELGVKEAFADLAQLMLGLSDATKQTIADCEMSDEYEAKIFMEDLLKGTIVPLRKQSEEWLRAAEALGPEDFNIHIGEYTHYWNGGGGK